MDSDDKVRPKEGIVVSMREMENGTSRLFIDDVVSNQESNPKSWSYKMFYTFTPEIENSILDNMELSENQLADIGAAVVARLLAIEGRVK